MRLVDRVLRPLFPKDYHAETQVMIQLMSHDENIEKISITVGYKKEILKKIISEQYKNRCKLEFITTEFQKPPYRQNYFYY